MSGGPIPVGAELANLFTPPAPGEPFRQGVIATFDPATGANTINVGGATLTNVPLLNIGDTVNLAPGDVVVLMKMNSSWAILGRVIIPGGEGLAASVVGTEVRSGFDTGFAVTTSDVSVALTSFFNIPTWANTAAVTASAYASGTNTTGTMGAFYVRAYIGTTDLGTELAVLAPAGEVVAASIGNVANFSGAIGGTTFQCSAVVSTDATTGNWATNGNNRALITATAIYTRV